MSSIVLDPEFLGFQSSISTFNELGASFSL